MFQKPSKCFMSEEDSGSNGSAPPPPPAEPTATTPAPALDLDALVTRLSGVMDEKIAASQNATHAALRKAGVFEKAKPSDPTPTTQPTQSAPSAQAGLTHADVDARFELERVIATREGKYGLNEAQARRLRSALSGVPRESFASEADAYLNDMGLAKAPPAPIAIATPSPAPVVPAKPNISDRGAAAPTDLRDSDGVVNSRPLEMTGHDVDSLILKHGHTKGLQMFQERVLAALGSVRIKPPSRG
jgi:hypothetical protein